MFDPTSRYFALLVKTLTLDEHDGSSRQIRYVERRFLPALGSSGTLLEHLVVDGDRLDNVSARYLGDPTQFWRIADANDGQKPEDLTDEVGRAITIALPF